MLAENEIVQEILQRLVRLETLIETKMNNQDDRIDKLEKVVNARIKKIEDNQTWLWRTIVGSLIAVAIGILMNK